MNLRQQAAAVKSAMQAIVDGATAESRDLTDDEATEIEAKAAEFKDLTAKAERAEKAAQTVASLAAAPIVEVHEVGANESLPLFGRAGKSFVQSDAYKGFKQVNPGVPSNGAPIHIEAKGVASVVSLGVGVKADLTTTTGQWSGAGREPGYRNELAPDEPLTFLNLITVGTTNVAYSEYARIVSETDNAAVVAEGALKPLSDLTTDTGESKAYVYADGFVITNQTLADDGALAAFMETRIRQHVRGVIERKLFNGTGAGTEPLGIMNTTGTLAQPFDVDVVTTLSRALEKFETANGNSNVQAIVMNPRDIWNLRLLREDGASGAYLLGNPLQQGATPTPWGVPLVPSNKLAQGSALVGRFDSVQYLELDPLNVLAFNQHENFARLNKVYVRAESRGRQIFYVPREVVVADLTAV